MPLSAKSGPDRRQEICDRNVPLLLGDRPGESEWRWGRDIGAGGDERRHRLEETEATSDVQRSYAAQGAHLEVETATR